MKVQTMPEATKRSMSDIRPVRGTLDLSQKSKPAAPKESPKAKTAAKAEPKAVVQEPVLEVEKFKELEAPKRRSGVWMLLAMVFLIAGAVGATYWIYATYIVK